MRSILSLTIILAAFPAEAARCPSGLIYRPSLGVCQTKAQVYRAGLRPVARLKARPKPVKITYENHLWNWVEANRAELIGSYQ